MRYLALVALLAFLAVPFLAGCAEKPAPAPKPPVEKKAGPTTPPAPPAPAPTEPAPPAPPAPAPK
jgi:hypothetical protein